MPDDIRAIDRQLLALLEQRAQLGDSVLSPTHIAAIWREIVAACRKTPLRVAYLGPAGTFSELAALAHFGASIERVACPSFDEVFRATTAGAADFGVVPVENSSEGVVSRTLDLLLESPLHVIGETSMAVVHNLLRSTRDKSDIVAVVAHAQALAQCQGWLSAHLPHVERRAVVSNAEGARLASQDARLAAIASERAADEYGLHVVAACIEDLPDNRTRFAVIAHPAKHAAPPASGRDRTSVVVSVPNRPGAVHDLLAPLKQHGVSMTRFESRPARSGSWEYYFHLDLDGHAHDERVAPALTELRDACAFYRLLGSYPMHVT